jgi:maltose phosphorylase
MKEGWLKRSFKATFANGNTIAVESIRFISFKINEIGVIQYRVKALNFSMETSQFSPYLDAGIKNEDSNYDEYFWKVLEVTHQENQAFICSETLKTEFSVCTSMQNIFKVNNQVVKVLPASSN